MMESKIEDRVNHPNHYAKSCSIECIDSMLIAFGKEEVIGYCKCNAYKYIWRYKNKNGLEDLDKALWYINKAKELINNGKEYYNIESLNIMETYIEKCKNESCKNP